MKNYEETIRRLKIYSSYLRSQIQKNQFISKHYQSTLNALKNATNNFDHESILIRSMIEQAQFPSSQKSIQSKTSSQIIASQKPSNHFQHTNSHTLTAQYQSTHKQLKRFIKLLQKKNFSQFQSPKKFSSSIFMKSNASISKGLAINSSNKIQNQQQKVKLDDLIRSELGEWPINTSQDQIVENLMKNIVKEEQKYIELIIQQNNLILKDKLKHMLSKISQRNEEKLNELKCEALENELQTLLSNKQIIKCGYTESMKKMINIQAK